MSAAPPESSAMPSARRSDIDWLRVIAFGLLILYHIALFYAPWDWHVNSRHRQGWIAIALWLTKPWRLTLLFFISGAATRFMADRMQPGPFLAERALRLLPPVLFGVFLLIPPQAYAEALEKGWYSGGFGAYWVDYMTVGQGLCLSGDICKPLPVNHLWFVLYIFVYAAILAALLTRPRWLSALGDRLERALRGAGFLALPILYLALMRLALFPTFGLTNNVWADPYNHAVSLPAFIAGYLLVHRPAFWAVAERQRWIALVIAIVAMLVLMTSAYFPGEDIRERQAPMMIADAVSQWSAIAAALGFAYRHLRHADGPVLRYLTRGIFTFYLVHQTIIVMTGAALDDLPLPGWVEALALILATIFGSAAALAIGERIGPLGILLGVSARRRRAARSTP